MSLPNPTDLKTMDYTYQGQPFVNVPAKSGMDLETLDLTYQAQPFQGNQEFFIDVVDALNITETLTGDVFFPVDLSDSLDITEDLVIDIDAYQLPDISVSDEVQLVENTPIYYFVFFDTFDDLNISEDVTSFLYYPAETNDTLDISEEVTAVTPDLGGIDVYDSVDVSEAVFIPLPILTEENINLTEWYDVDLLHPDIIISDSLNLTDNFGPYMEINISTASRLNLTDAAEGQATLGDIVVSDNLAITDNVGAPYQYYEFLTYSGLNISENNTFEQVSYAFTFDGLIFVDYVIDISNPTLGGINVVSNINISENYGNVGILYVNVSSSIAISAAVTILIPSLNINKVDNMLIRERVSRNLYYSIVCTENINISESKSLLVPVGIFIVEVIDLTEFVDYANLNEITVGSAVNLSESITLETFKFSPVPGRRRPVAMIGWDS